MSAASIRTGWRIVEGALLGGWVAAALYGMYPQAPGGELLVGSFVTTHLADLTLPAWLYIVFRRRPRGGPWRSFVGGAPYATAAALFLASAGSEVSQAFWPDGPFRGVFDPLDLAAYAAGLAAVLVADRRWPIRPAPTALGEVAPEVP